MSRRTSLLGALARAGFDDLDRASATVATLAESSGVAADTLIGAFSLAADPDAASAATLRLRERAPDAVDRLLGDAGSAERLARVAGASRGLAEFFERHPSESALLAEEPDRPEPQRAAHVRLAEAVDEGTRDGVDLDRATSTLRTRYRRLLSRIAVWDLTRASAVEAVDTVAAGLADLA